MSGNQVVIVIEDDVIPWVGAPIWISDDEEPENKSSEDGAAATNVGDGASAVLSASAVGDSAAAVLPAPSAGDSAAAVLPAPSAGDNAAAVLPAPSAGDSAAAVLPAPSAGDSVAVVLSITAPEDGAAAAADLDQEEQDYYDDNSYAIFGDDGWIPVQGQGWDDEDEAEAGPSSAAEAGPSSGAGSGIWQSLLELGNDLYRNIRCNDLSNVQKLVKELKGRSRLSVLRNIPVDLRSTCILAEYLKTWANFTNPATVVSMAEALLDCGCLPRLRDIEDHVRNHSLQMDLRKLYLHGKNRKANPNEKIIVTKDHRLHDLSYNIYDPLLVAIIKRDMDFVRELYENCSVFIAIPIYRKGGKSRSYIQEAIHADNMEAVQYLIEKNANVNKHDSLSRGSTSSPLMTAASLKRVAMVEVLISAGAILDDKARASILSNDSPRLDMMTKAKEALKARSASQDGSRMMELVMAAEEVEEEDAGPSSVENLLNVAAAEAAAIDSEVTADKGRKRPSPAAASYSGKGKGRMYP